MKLNMISFSQQQDERRDPISRLQRKAFLMCLVIATLFMISTGCKKFAGLSLQTDATHSPYLLNPDLNMTAWQYLKYRSGVDTTNPAWRTDTVFRLMYKAVLYSGIDTNEYTKPNRTFIFLHNLAIQTFNATVPVTVSNTCYWGYYLVGPSLVPATSWTQYTPAQVKAWLQYLIVDGEYNFNNLNPNAVTVNTLLPQNTDTLNPQSIMVLARNDDPSSGSITINNFVGSFDYTTVRTGGYVSTNGPIQVVGNLVIFKRTQ